MSTIHPHVVLISLHLSHSFTHTRPHAFTHFTASLFQSLSHSIIRSLTYYRAQTAHTHTQTSRR